MASTVISLPVANSSENIQALAEVSDFARTDMGYFGQGPWTYRILKEPFLTERLAQAAGAQSYLFGVDVVSFQPCPSYVLRSQDRYVVEEWALPGGKWIFNAVFDGHLNHHAVDFAVQTLPNYIRSDLHTELSDNVMIAPSQVSGILKSSIRRVDDCITSRFLDLLPRDLDALNKLDESHILSAIHGDNEEDVARSLGGTTLVLSLTDSLGNLWIASLGDCLAVLGQRCNDSWLGRQITSIHDLNNPKELSRIVHDHPNEVNATKDGRVIGFLEPTRAIGDTWLKLPAVYASRIYSRLKQPWISSNKLKEYAHRILTPPYVSNTPDIYHCVPEPPYFVLLSSDGLLSTEQYTGMDTRKAVQCWTDKIGQSVDCHSRTGLSNHALWLLRDAIGGDDLHMASRNLTVEMEERWIDDTTILIQKVGCV